MKASKWLISKLDKTDHCPVALPWMKLGSDERFEHVHRYALLLEQNKRGHGLCYIVAAVYPLVSGINALRASRRLNKLLDHNHEVGTLKRYLRLLKINLIYNIPLDPLLNQYVDTAVGIETLQKYVHKHEVQTLCGALNRSVGVDVNDKLKCKRFFEDNNLPVSHLIAKLRPETKDHEIAQLGERLRTSLFMKPNFENGGKGTYKATYDAQSDVWTINDATYTFDDLCSFLRELTRNKVYIIETLVEVIADIADLAPCGLPTFRVQTYNDGHNIKVIYTVLRIPRGDAIVDNLSSGGLVAGVIADDHTLSPARAGDELSEFKNHPDTGAQIAGRFLPFMPDVHQLATEAHQCSDLPKLIGWDIAMTNTGPILIEANSVPSTDVPQLGFNCALGEHQGFNSFDAFSDLIRGNA